MTNFEFFELLIQYAKEYNKNASDSIYNNKHMNEIDQASPIEDEHIEAVLVDFINYVALKYGIDLALYTKDLNE